MSLLMLPDCPVMAMLCLCHTQKIIKDKSLRKKNEPSPCTVIWVTTSSPVLDWKLHESRDCITFASLSLTPCLLITDVQYTYWLGWIKQICTLKVSPQELKSSGRALFLQPSRYTFSHKPGNLDNVVSTLSFLNDTAIYSGTIQLY